jgi:predicted dithiol-disulfide oxidoreductase (DUF899 family)
MNRPRVVSDQQWWLEREELLAQEKRLTRELDALAARRRRMPMVALDPGYRFTAADGSEVGLAALFDGRRQLVIYHVMLAPGQDHYCVGCSSFVDNLADPVHLRARDTELILMCRAPQVEIEGLRSRMGWTLPWFSSGGSTFEDDLGVGDLFGLSVLLRCESDDPAGADEFFRTYFTSWRGVDRLRTDLNLLDLTPYGRQEAWEDSPAGWPQEPTWSRMRHKDEYVTAVAPVCACGTS